MAKYAIVIEYEYCTGCHSCEVACHQEKGFPVEEWGIKVAEMGPKKFESGWQWDYVPIRSHICDYCEDRIAVGKKASCEHHCLAQCLKVLPVEEAASVLRDSQRKVCILSS